MAEDGARTPGNPDVVRVPEAGLAVEENTPDGIAAGIARLLAAPPDRMATRAYAAERFGLEATTQAQLLLFGLMTAAKSAPAPSQAASDQPQRA